MFEDTPTAPPDAIFGLAEAFRNDPRENKINLGIGVYRDDSGRTPVMQAVRLAEERIWSSESSKSYLPIEGDRAYASQVQALLFGSEHEVIGDGRIATAQTPGGTGAISVAAALLKKLRPQSSAWVSEPTWINHKNIFAAAGLPVATYEYLTPTRRELAFEAMLRSLESARPGDVVVLHGCCHNPSGVDPDSDQWREIAAFLRHRSLLPLVDIAYQGFGAGVDDDRQAVLALAATLPELIVCNSFSKNFALYNERVGALTVVAARASNADAVLSQVKTCIRVSYSNPPAHGAAIVRTILQDPALETEWRDELATMRSRIEQMRRTFADGLDKRGVRMNGCSNRDFLRHRGMFSFTGLEKSQIETLRQEHGIYMLASSRINFAGLSAQSADSVCDAVAAVSQQ